MFLNRKTNLDGITEIFSFLRPQVEIPNPNNFLYINIYAENFYRDFLSAFFGFNLVNINRTKLEKLIHRFFERAQLGIQIKDRFGQPVVPRERFLVPLFVIDELVEKIKDGTIGDYEYDPQSACLKQGG